MNQLKQSQYLFYEAIFDPDQTDFDRTRIAVYRQSIFDRLRRALFITYPGIWRLLGEPCANSFAYLYVNNKENLPKSGNLDEWGDAFPKFLAQQPKLSNLPYLKAYGEYEWLKHLAYGAHDAPALDFSALTSLSEEQLESCVLNLIPSAYLYQSIYPLDQIQEIIENSDAGEIILENRPCYLLIARPENTVISYWLSEEYFVFLNYLKNCFTLGKAIQEINDVFPNFDLPNMINFLVENKIVSNPLTRPSGGLSREAEEAKIQHL